jgi:parallel beta-helix repeat protein
LALLRPQDIDESSIDRTGYPDGDETPRMVALSALANQQTDDTVVVSFTQDVPVSYIRQANGAPHDRYLGQYPNRSGVNFERDNIRLTSPNKTGLTVLPSVKDIPLTFNSNPVPGYCYTALSIGQRRPTPTANLGIIPLLRGVTVEGIKIDGSGLDDEAYRKLASATISGGLAVTHCENVVIDDVEVKHITGFTGGITLHIGTGFSIVRRNRVLGRLIAFTNPTTGQTAMIKFGNLYWLDGIQDTIFDGNYGELGANSASFATNHDSQRRSQDCNISNNIFKHSNAGITLHGAGHTVRENVLTNCGFGFVIEHTANQQYVARHNRIVGNTVEITPDLSVRGYGIELRGTGSNWTEQALVESNTFKRLRDGIILRSNTVNNIVRLNTLQGCTNALVLDGDTELTNEVRDNIIAA